MLIYIISQVLNYGIWWLVFVAIAFLMARVLGWGGAIIGQIIIFLIVRHLDYEWLQVEMTRSGWDGLPDQDAAFFGAVLVHVLTVNSVLLAVNAIAIRVRSPAKSEAHKAKFEHKLSKYRSTRQSHLQARS